MFDFGDFFVTTAEIGSEGRGWRSVWAILGLLIGAGIAGWFGYQAGGVSGALAGLPTGALLGWAAAVFLRGLAVFLLIMAVCLVVVLGWAWLTGALF